MADGGGPERTVRRQSGEMLPGTRAGDRRLRVARREQQEITVRRLVFRPRRWNPALVFVYGFAGVIGAGTLVLMLPFASASGQATGLIDALFTATSAVCVTGLVVLDTGTYWSGFGQWVILSLIQIGGFGFMTSSTLLLMVLGRRTGIRERVLATEALGGGTLGSAIIVIRSIALFTIVAELLGIVVLSFGFLPHLDPPLALWWGVFHSISAFNNAGFDVTGGFRSIVPFAAEPAIVLPVAALLIVGGASYVALDDIVRNRRFVRLSLDTKLVLLTSLALAGLGTAALLVLERGNADTLGGLDPGTRVMTAFFQSVTARTAGFNTVDIGKMTDAGLIVIIALMFVGGAAGSTAGGIKVQTFGVLFFAIVSAVRGQIEVEAFRRRIQLASVMRAIAVALLALALVFAASLALSVSEDFAFTRILFEAFSAFGTVGLSTGITPETTGVGRLIIIVTMFAGRLGPLTLVLALTARQRARTYRLPETPVRIG